MLSVYFCQTGLTTSIDDNARQSIIHARGFLTAKAILRKTSGEVSSGLQKELDEFKIKLDGYRVQLALGSIEDETALARRKMELQQQVDEIRLKLQKETKAGDRVDQFVDDISKFFDHGFFHADPYSGNIFILRDKIICFIDYGMMREVVDSDKELLADVPPHIYSIPVLGFAGFAVSGILALRLLYSIIRNGNF